MEGFIFVGYPTRSSNLFISMLQIDIRLPLWVSIYGIGLIGATGFDLAEVYGILWYMPNCPAPVVSSIKAKIVWGSHLKQVLLSIGSWGGERVDLL